MVVFVLCINAANEKGGVERCPFQAYIGKGMQIGSACRSGGAPTYIICVPTVPSVADHVTESRSCS